MATHDMIGARLHSDRASAPQLPPLYDPLTGLPTPALLHDRLAQALATAERALSAVAVLVVTLDEAPRGNGPHEAGCALALRLRQALRSSDTVAPLGPGTLAVVLPDADGAGARRVSEKLGALLAAAGDGDGQRTRIGIAVAPEQGADPAALLERAHAASRVHAVGGTP